MKYECKKCKGQCCSFVPLNGAEYLKLKQLGLKDEDVENVADDTFVMTKDDTGICPFLNEKKLCSIYENRPNICRMLGTKQMPCMKMPGGREKINRIIDEIVEAKS